MRLVQPRHPNRLEAQHPRIIEDLIDIAEDGHQSALDSLVLMLEDLTVYGTHSRFAQTLQGNPIWELKTRSRGGTKGGARVYCFSTLVKAMHFSARLSVATHVHRPGTFSW
jgi:hypothetical protein